MFSPTPGEGCMSKNPKYVDPDDGDFRLQNDSPCRDAAEGGEDMGAIETYEAVDAVSFGHIKALF
jgi:hypothetical protein